MVRIRIATKIFFLAVSLLCLTVALTAFGTLQTDQLVKENDRIWSRYMPLNNTLDDVDVDRLKRRLAFERWERVEISDHPDPSQIAAAAAEYRAHDALLHSDLDKTRKLLEAHPGEGSDAGEIARIHGLFDEILRDTDLAANVQQRILDHHNAQNRPLADELLRLHETLQKDLEDRRHEIGNRIEAVLNGAGLAARARVNGLVRITVASTSFAVLFGLVFAWLVSRRMVQPVQILMSGVRSVEQGALTIQIPINSSDEIGFLTGPFNHLVSDLRSKEQLKETFGKYIAPRIVEKVILNPGAAETEGGKRVMTISFCDLVGFTGISENLSPAGLVRLLNRHFALVATAIHAYQGVLDKFIGDAPLAFWGPPFSASGDHATQACRAALAHIRVLETLRLELPELTGLRKHIPILDLRIGGATGDVVA